ncbi:MAG: type IV conjugative transfer system protein TraL [Alphaproteobacteria bacterium 41-28]|nr:MAG: type IV conjugative transfer system protein TraL [Alphaproteobacteria bacterium 41-28]
MDSSENYILNRLDKPLRFLGINKDEAFALIVPLMGGLFMGWVLTGFILGAGSLSLLRMLKKHNEGAMLIHALYWHLPTHKKAFKLPVLSHIREYIG